MAGFSYKRHFGKNADIPPAEISGSAPGSLLTEISQESDKLLVLALMILLAKDGADMKLLLALGYILL
ncbi:MAG: hypothetical protein NC040_10920 [Muribaculaceae bacterium]|nr:hypothetical protein [Alistipes senegalensis]MCM1474564.1 hypothetical protein [Muribaculaceae bacterium]MDE6424655.1 hypothetical protein [Ruminococcus sp.]